MAESEGPSKITRAALAVFGVAMVIVGAVLHDHEAYSIAVSLAGVLVVLFAAFGSQVRRAKAGPLEIEMHDERAAAAKAADDSVQVDAVAAEIASTDDAPPSPSPEDESVIGVLNYQAGDIALRGLLERFTERGTLLAGCHLRLYLFDEETGVLRSVAGVPDFQTATEWRPGQGATGAAYSSGELVFATGDTVWDDTYDLTPQQQERFRHLKAVASAPVYSSSGEIIAVVTASTKDHASALVWDDDTIEELLLVALLVSRLLIELFQWFDD